MKSLIGILLLILITSTSFAGDPSSNPIVKAFEKIRKVDNRKYIRLTTAPDLADDEEKQLIIVEFGDGTLGIYADDQWILIEKKNLEMLDECATRCRHH